MYFDDVVGFLLVLFRFYNNEGYQSKIIINSDLQVSKLNLSNLFYVCYIVNKNEDMDLVCVQ